MPDVFPYAGWAQRQAPALPPAWRHREAPQDQDVLSESGDTVAERTPGARSLS